MNIELVTGCAAAGVVAGWLLDGVSVTIPPFRPPARTGADEEPAPGQLGLGPVLPDLVEPNLADPVERATPLGALVPPAPGPDGPDAEHLAQPSWPPLPVPGPVPPDEAEPPEAAEPWALVPDRTSRWVERVVATLVTGAALGLAAVRLGPVPQLGGYCALLVGLVAVSAVDLRVGLVPRKILYPTFGLLVIGLLGASAVQDDWTAMAHAAIAGVVAFVLFFAIWWFHPRGLGFGDVRLAGVMAVGLGWLGFSVAYLGFLAAFVIGALYGLVVMAVLGTGRRTRIAFGPALALGAAIGILWGPTLAQAWLHSAGG